MDPYEVLGVEPGADRDDIRRAYLAAARRSHPDFHDGDEAARRAAEHRMRELNLAWEELNDPRRGVPAGEPWRPHDPSPAPGFDERHDRPITAGGIPGWLRLAPPGAFVGGITAIVIGGSTGILPIVAAGLICLLASVALFVVAPLVALTSSHRGSGHRESR